LLWSNEAIKSKRQFLLGAITMMTRERPLTITRPSRAPSKKRLKAKTRSDQVPSPADQIRERLLEGLKIAKAKLTLGEFRREAKKILKGLEQVRTNGKGIDFFENTGALSDGGKYIWALVLWADFLVKGEEVVLGRLPFLLQIDFKYYFTQTWIQNLIFYWYVHGDEEKIKRALFGTPKRGTRSFKLAMQNHQRDIRIASAVQALLDNGIGYNEALRAVAAQLTKLGVQDHLSPQGIRTIHSKVKSGYNPLVRLFQLSN
jgi:hypothetical protein